MQSENSVSVPGFCREYGMGAAVFYKLRSKVGCRDASMMGRLKELVGENTRLKQMYAAERQMRECAKRLSRECP